MRIHGIISTYFGSDEWDAPKTIQWTKYFCHTEYLMDTDVDADSRGLNRAWGVRFPDVKSGVYTAFDYFSDPAGWRRESFAQADMAWGYEDDDWVLFVDGTESLFVDDNYPPSSMVPPAQPTGPDEPRLTLDPDNPFAAYVIAEAEGAELVGEDIVYLRTWAFVANSPMFVSEQVVDPALAAEIEGMVPGEVRHGMTKDDLEQVNTSRIPVMWAYYALAGWCPRLVRVSALRDPLFDWSVLDTYVASSPQTYVPISCSLVSYAYARWVNDPALADPATGMPSTEENDVGFRMRKRISGVRNIPQLPYTSWPPDDSGAALYFAFLPDPALNTLTPTQAAGRGKEFGATEVSATDEDFSDDFQVFLRRDVSHPWQVSPWPVFSELELTTPIYPLKFREDVWSGTYYDPSNVSPPPWNYFTGKPSVSPEEWDQAYGTPNDLRPEIGVLKGGS